MADMPHEPIMSLSYELAADGTYTAVAAVLGLQSAEQAEAALNHMQMLLCAAEVETKQ